jgi:alpha-mannosidase
VHGHTLSLSLLCSPVNIDPLADKGYHAFPYALMLHESSLFDSIIREAEDHNQSLLVRPLYNIASGTW